MHSRAHLLIEREYQKFISNPPWGIEIHPLKENNLFEWAAKIRGLKDTLWEGGIFRVYLKFDEAFNENPPKVCFHTIPFHPNIDMITGKPCIDFLDNLENWNASCSLTFILLSVQALLSNPNLDDPVNPEAVDLLRNSSHAYRQIVLDCVTASQRLEDGLRPHSQLSCKVRFAPDFSEPVSAAPPVTAPTRISTVSFEEYLRTWNGIATSKAHPDVINPLLESIKNNPILQKAHLGLPIAEINEQMNRHVDEHTTLMYGKFKVKKSDREQKDAKLAKLNNMRKIYLPARQTPETSGLYDNPPPTQQGKEEAWEQEVDALVAWSSKLDEDDVET